MPQLLKIIVFSYCYTVKGLFFFYNNDKNAVLLYRYYFNNSSNFAFHFPQNICHLRKNNYELQIISPSAEKSLDFVIITLETNRNFAFRQAGKIAVQTVVSVYQNSELFADHTCRIKRRN